MLSEQLNVLRDISSSLVVYQNTELLNDAISAITQKSEIQNAKISELSEKIKDIQSDLEVTRAEVEDKIQSSSSQNHLDEIKKLEDEKINMLQRIEKLEAEQR
ncbi:hypothetical protein BB560_001694 [Smittium megazygosporum]|uniref:Uncharacterized protein n=1 Tax=Smittium megazygosporum TaxID=133381 RepID=A0A2T9ZGV5_9FUNG|nr:hypothetical protein BB560_001694 [Smittium megazygosporum]